MSFEENQIEFMIINSLLTNDLYLRNYVNKFDKSLFSPSCAIIYKIIEIHFKKYSCIATPRVISDVYLPKAVKNDVEREKIKNVLDTCTVVPEVLGSEYAVLIEETKKFIKKRRIMNCVIECFQKIEEGKEEEVEQIYEEAFKFDFDETLGIEYWQDLEARKLRSSIKDDVISTGIPSLDRLIGGGYRRKGLFIWAGPANSGKTLFLNDAATSVMMNGYNVVYFTLELPEDYITKRTDAKIAGVNMKDIYEDPMAAIDKAIIKRDSIKKNNKKVGQLYYKEYSPGTISCNDIRGYLKTLEIKKNFKPDFIVIDYIGNLKPNGKSFADNTYGVMKTISEEVRTLGFEYDACTITATQTGRQSFGRNDIGMADVSDSIGIAQTADVMITISRTKELDAAQDAILTAVKSRFSKNGSCTIVHVDYNNMKIVDKSENSMFVAKVNSSKNNEDATSIDDDFDTLTAGDENEISKNTDDKNLSIM